MGKYKYGIAVLVMAGLLCTNSTIQSQASAIAIKGSQIAEDFMIKINEEQVPTSVGELPSSVDNSLNEYFPPIISQGTYESCSSWAVTYYQTSSEFNRVYNLDASLPENQLSPMWTYNFTNGGQNAGTYFTDVVKVLKEIGAVDMATIPVDADTGEIEIGNLNASKEMFKKASERRITNYYRISNGESNRLDNSTPITNPKAEVLNEAKIALSQGHILSASSPGNKWIYSTIEQNDDVPANEEFLGEQIVSRCDKSGYSGHRIAIVGYNDDIWVDINENEIIDEGEKGAFKIANSRGMNYGNDGFMWISYDALNHISSVHKNSAIDLGYENREPALIDIISVEINTNQTEPEYYVEFDAETSSVAGMSVVISATSKKDGNPTPYRPVPFKRAVDIGLGDASFDGSKSVAKGSFAINLGNMFTDISPNNINDYKWYICVGNFAKKDVPITYSNFRIVDKNGKVVKTGNLNKVTLEDGDKYIEFK